PNRVLRVKQGSFSEHTAWQCHHGPRRGQAGKPLPAAGLEKAQLGDGDGRGRTSLPSPQFPYCKLSAALSRPHGTSRTRRPSAGQSWRHTLEWSARF
ncbi:Hypothetical predicted protein, partial [Marmota monax]